MEHCPPLVLLPSSFLRRQTHKINTAPIDSRRISDRKESPLNRKQGVVFFIEW